MKNIIFGFSFCFATISWATEPTVEKCDRAAKLDALFTEYERKETAAKREAKMKSLFFEYFLCLSRIFTQSVDADSACASWFQEVEKLGIEPEELRSLKQQTKNLHDRVQRPN